MSHPDARADLLAYHRLSSHAPDRYAPGPGHLDWATQPDPFRRYAGAPRTDLPDPEPRLGIQAAVLAGNQAPAQPLELATLGRLLRFSLGLAAWKQWGESRWALRCNPSSGNLHPTEAYVVTPGLPGLAPGVHHYVSLLHALEHRATLARPEALTAAWPAEGVLVGLTGIVWREAWKYGTRAWRYCQLDTGHALAALACAAAALGWRARLLTAFGDAQIATLLGLDRADDRGEAEPETPEALLWVGPEAPGQEPDPAVIDAAFRLAGPRWQGRPNRLSPRRREWPGIAEAERLARKPPTPPVAPLSPATGPPLPAALPGDRTLDAGALFLQRRSAVAYDARTGLPAAHLWALLDRLLHRPGLPPWDAVPWPPRVALALLVHRVEGLEPGVYLLPRGTGLAGRGEPVEEAPPHLGLVRLALGDVRHFARLASCHQEIAADGCLAFAMLARLDTALDEGCWWYRWLHWEAGAVGQMLYLGAELCGLRGTGIGCFFDALVPQALGAALPAPASDLYHFTLGAPVDDRRLRTHPPYEGLAGWRAAPWAQT